MGQPGTGSAGAGWGPLRGGLPLLAWRHAWHHRGRTLLLVGCLAVPIFLPLASAGFVQRYEQDLSGRAEATPLVAGARGSRFDLCLGALHFRRSGLSPIPHAEASALQASGDGLAIPLHFELRARGLPLVGTSPEYLELRALAPERGRSFLRIGECVLGSSAAIELGLAPGDTLFTDQEELYDISRPPALAMRVVGVLAPAGTPDDEAVFTDLKTTWIAAGFGHGHQEVADGSLDESLVLGRSESTLAVSPAVMEYEEVTAENAEDFHFHGELDGLPLSAVLFVPRSAKSATLARSRVGRSPGHQMIVPAEIVEELLSLVLRVKSLLDGFLALLGAATLLLLGLVLLLSARLRRAEMRTLERIGAPPKVALQLYGLEFAVVLLLAALLGLAATGITLELITDPARILT